MFTPEPGVKLGKRVLKPKPKAETKTSEPKVLGEKKDSAVPRRSGGGTFGPYNIDTGKGMPPKPRAGAVPMPHVRAWGGGKPLPIRIWDRDPNWVIYREAENEYERLHPQTDLEEERAGLDAWLSRQLAIWELQKKRLREAHRT